MMPTPEIRGIPLTNDRIRELRDEIDDPVDFQYFKENMQPIATRLAGEPIRVYYLEDEDPRVIAATFVEGILGNPYFRRTQRPRKEMGPYESALWKLEMEVGGELIRLLEPILDAKPGAVRKAMRAALAEVSKPEAAR